jgi:RNA polymerase sigma-70 factor (ECF subfamily)
MSAELTIDARPNCAIIAPELSEASPQRRPRHADDELARRLISRDPRALAEVYERFGSVSFGFLVNLLRDRQAAEDVQQQVFLEVWQRAPTFDPARAGLLTWIMTIARSRAIDHLRRRIPEPAGTMQAETGSAAAGDETERLVERWHFAGLLRQLPSDEAKVLRLRFYDELTQVEIAGRTGIALGTVKSRMVSGLRRLRELMEEQ